MIVKLTYSVFIGVIITVFIGVGISTFYEAPEELEYPEELQYSQVDEEQTEEQQQYTAEQKAYDKAREAWDEENQNYNRNYALVLIAFSVALMGLAATYFKHVEVIGEGLMFGGVFNLLHGITRGATSGTDLTRLGIIGFCVALAIYFAYLNFVKQAVKQKKEE